MIATKWDHGFAKGKELSFPPADPQELTELPCLPSSQ